MRHLLRSCGLWNWGLLAVVGLAAIAHSSNVLAEEPTIELLWPFGAPDAKGTADGDKPSMSVWLAPTDTANGTGVVICVGGGYSNLALGHEGADVAKWLNTLGVSAFVLKYRHSKSGAGYRHPTPLHDAQRAIRLVRARADKWKLDPKRIGILGFSAGGHLASSVGTHFDKGDNSAADPIDRVSCRPDFMILAYPAVTLSDAYTHAGSKKNLLGENPSAKLVESLSNENQVTAETPPTFMMHTGEDTAVVPENSILFYSALRRAKVPVELHIYEFGKHGLGLAPEEPGAKTWPDRCADWMRRHDLLKKTAS